MHKIKVTTKKHLKHYSNLISWITATNITTLMVTTTLIRYRTPNQIIHKCTPTLTWARIQPELHLIFLQLRNCNMQINTDESEAGNRNQFQAQAILMKEMKYCFSPHANPKDVMGPSRRSQGYLFVFLDWQVRLFGPSGIVDWTTDHMYVRTIPLYGCMYRYSLCIPFYS